MWHEVFLTRQIQKLTIVMRRYFTDSVPLSPWDWVPSPLFIMRRDSTHWSQPKDRVAILFARPPHMDFFLVVGICNHYHASVDIIANLPLLVQKGRYTFVRLFLIANEKGTNTTLSSLPEGRGYFSVRPRRYRMWHKVKVWSGFNGHSVKKLPKPPFWRSGSVWGMPPSYWGLGVKLFEPPQAKSREVRKLKTRFNELTHSYMSIQVGKN